MAIFDRLDRMASAACDGINAREFVLTPKISTPNGRPIDDVDRSTITGKGIFDYYSVEHGIQLGVRRSYREANDLRALQNGREPILSVDRKYFPAPEDEPRQGDVITFPNNPDLPTFDVMAVKRDGMARMDIELVHRSPQT